MSRVVVATAVQASGGYDAYRHGLPVLTHDAANRAPTPVDTFDRRSRIHTPELSDSSSLSQYSGDLLPAMGAPAAERGFLAKVRGICGRVWRLLCQPRLRPPALD